MISWTQQMHRILYYSKQLNNLCFSDCHPYRYYFSCVVYIYVNVVLFGNLKYLTWLESITWIIDILKESSIRYHFDGCVQDCSNPSANALEALLSCTKLSIYNTTFQCQKWVNSDTVWAVSMLTSRGCLFACNRSVWLPLRVSADTWVICCHTFVGSMCR